MKYTKNQIIEAEICDLNMLGFGVAKIDGAVFFVQNGVVGDVAKLRVIKCAKNYYVCRIEEMIRPGKDRVAPSCSHFKTCGGCSFQHIRYELELDIKKRFVESCLRKAGLAQLKVLPVISAGHLEGYRNKAQYPVGRDEKGSVISGFYSTRSHKICKVDNCMIQDPQFAPITAFLCDFFEKNKILPYMEESGDGLVRHIFLRCGKATGEISLCLVLRENSFPKTRELIDKVNEKFPNIVSISFNIQPQNSNVILGKETHIVYGKEKIEDVLCDRHFLISPQSFYQVNRDGAELLYNTAFQMADLERFDMIVDLYCGIGSISLSAKTSSPIVGVEIISDAVMDAQKNAERNSVDNAKFYCGDASDAFRIIETSGAENPLVIVDPPRKGLAEKLIDDIATHSVNHVLYISCNPETMARDLVRFVEYGYAPQSVQPVDMFPRTSHVETVALLSRQINVHK